MQFLPRHFCLSSEHEDEFSFVLTVVDLWPYRSVQSSRPLEALEKGQVIGKCKEQVKEKTIIISSSNCCFIGGWVACTVHVGSVEPHFPGIASADP